MKIPPIAFLMLLMAGCTTPEGPHVPGAKLTGANLPPVINSEKLGANTTPPRPIVMTNAEYPFDMRRRGIEATLIVHFVVNIDGRVAVTKIFNSPDPAFDRAVLRSAKDWRFEPAMRDGKPTAVTLSTPVTFGLK